MTNQGTETHEKAVKNKSVGEAQRYCRINKVHNRWVTETEQPDNTNPKRLTMVIGKSNLVVRTYWG